MTFLKPYNVFLASIVVLALLSGCARTTTQISSEDLLPVKTIIVLPVEIDPDVQGKHVSKESLQLEKGQKIVDTMLAEYFSGRKDILLLTAGQRDALDKGMAHNRINAAVNIGRKKKAEAVLICTLHRFTEREGSEYSIASPASVSFDYKLVLTDNGQILCSNAFNETQQPLLADIFQFFKKAQRGFKWLSAEELARDGIAQKISNCPYLKQ